MKKKPSRTVSPSLYDREYFLSHCEGYREFSDGTLSRRLQMGADHISDARPLKILDVGCGRGELIQHLAKRGHICEGIDYSNDAVEIARKSAENQLSENERQNCHFQPMNAARTTFENDTFDMVLMLDVVEHLYPAELEKVFKEVNRTLKPGGRLLIHTVPNKWVVKPARLAMKLLNIASETDRHVNEQSLSTLKKAVRPHFSGRVWIERERGFWSFWGESSKRAPNRTIASSLRALDFVLDNRIVSPLIELPPLIFFLGTDIWADLKAK